MRRSDRGALPVRTLSREKWLCPREKYRRIDVLWFNVPLLRIVRGAPRFSPGVSTRQTSWEDPNDLEDSEDCRSVGGHGNQHVRLRSAQIDCIETICRGSGGVCRFEPRQTSVSKFPVRDVKDKPSRPHRKISEFINRSSPISVSRMRCSAAWRCSASPGPISFDDRLGPGSASRHSLPRRVRDTSRVRFENSICCQITGSDSSPASPAIW